MGRYIKKTEDTSGLVCPVCSRGFFTQYQFDMHLYFKHNINDPIHPSAKRDIAQDKETQVMIERIRNEP